MKSGKFDTPIDFNPSLDIPNYHIVYIDLVEVTQGGPRVGQLSINGETVPNYRFGGPFLYTGEYIFIPALIRSAFVLTKIDMKGSIINFIGEPKGIIWLEKIENNIIFYFDSLDQQQLKKYDISEFRLSGDNDTPINFNTKISLGQNEIQYIDLQKIRGGLTIGKLLINGNNLFKGYFGGPFLYNDTSIIIPIYTKSIFFSRFKIALINLEDNDIQIRGTLRKIIFLSKYENNKMFYYSDLNRKDQNVIK